MLLWRNKPTYLPKSLAILRHHQYVQCTIILFVFSNLVPRAFWLYDRGEGAFFHIKKPTCPGNEVVYLVTVWKLNCGC